MSIIILVPFDLATIDSRNMKMQRFDAVAENNPKKELSTEEPANVCDNITDNLIEIGKFYLNTSTKLREASSQFLSNLFARSDILKTQTIAKFLTWAAETIQKYESDPFSINLCAGIYSSIVEIFKIG